MKEISASSPQSLLQKYRNLILQIVSYGIIGLISSGTDAALFGILVYEFHTSALITNIVSVSVGITISFFLNRRFTFKVKDHTAKRYVMFFAIGMAGLLLSEGIIIIGTIVKLDVMIAKLLSIFIVAAFQFILNKFISFRPSVK